ncbi:MAG: ATP-binding cassette domain-containing protein, partial [Finegoldia magna]|nr:ATP-binding cassette domain-containing protein [Finegoldia magna]
MYLGCMLVGIWLVFKDRITIGQVIESSQLMAYVTGPLLNFTDIMTSFKSSKPVQNKIMNFISEEKPVELEDEFEFNNLKLNNISFKYPTSDKYVLKKLYFTFEKGKKYIIIGESGTGKSTIFKILQKQEIATEGEVQLNNKNILDIT